jgi:hypothetical protein
MPDKYRGPHSTHTHQHTWRASLTHAASGPAAPSPQTALRPPLLPNGASSGQQESSHVALSTQCHGCAVRPQRPTASRHTQQQEQPTASSAHTIHSTQAQGRPRYPQPKASALSAAAPAHQGPAAGNRPGESHAQVPSPPWRDLPHQLLPSATTQYHLILTSCMNPALHAKDPHAQLLTRNSQHMAATSGSQALYNNPFLSLHLSFLVQNHRSVCTHGPSY